MKINYYIAFKLIIFIASNIYCCVGAKPFGMAETYIGIANDIYAIYWNPAVIFEIVTKLPIFIELGILNKYTE